MTAKELREQLEFLDFKIQNTTDTDELKDLRFKRENTLMSLRKQERIEWEDKYERVDWD